MGCTFPNEPFTTVVPDWHPMESYFDARDGLSPLMQLCRVIGSIHSEFHLPEIEYHRVGTDHGDTAPATTDYEAHPEWNAYYDFATILEECHTHLRSLVLPDIVGDDCNKRTLTNRSDLLDRISDLDSPAYDFELTLLWQPIIEILRECVELVLDGEMELEDHLALEITWQSYYQGEREYRRYENQSDAMVQRTFDGCNDYEIRYRGGYNHWADRGPTCEDMQTATVGYYTPWPGLGAYFMKNNVRSTYVNNTPGGLVRPWTGTVVVAPDGSYVAMRMGDGATCYTTTETYCDQYVKFGTAPGRWIYYLHKLAGWYTSYSFDGVMVLSLTEPAPAELDGVEVDWYLPQTGNGVTVETTPNEGQIILEEGKRDYAVEVSMVLVDVDFTGVDEWASRRLFAPAPVMDPPLFTLCTDFCGERTYSGA